MLWVELENIVEDEHFDIKNVVKEPEPKEPNTCCRCSQDTEDDFESESCGHSVCVDCRFKDNIQCLFCTTTNDNKVKTTTEPDIFSLDILSYMKKELNNKDHIIDIKEDCTKNVVKQMCTVCNRVFLKSNARYHYRCASGEKPLECSECGRKFVKKSHLQSHLNSHFGIKPFKCTVRKCKASFTQKDKLVRHMKTHEPEKHMCQVCDKAFSSLPILQFHMQKVHTTAKLFKCDMCPRTYKYKKTLKVHRLKHQGVKEHLCDICGKKYTVAAQLKQHKCSHLPVSRRHYKCGRRFCKQRFISRHDKSRHELIHINTGFPDFECSLCNTTFGRKDNLERHMKNFHQEEPWNSGKRAVKIIALVAPRTIDKSSVDSNGAINSKKINRSVEPGKCRKKNQCDITETCKKDKNKKNISKKRVQIKNNKKLNQQVCVQETAKPLPIVNSKETLKQFKLEQVSSVIVRVSSVINKAPKLQQQQPNPLPLEEKAFPIVNNITGHSSTNTSLNVNNHIAAHKHTLVKNNSSANIQNEGKPILETDTLNVCCRKISHADSLKGGNVSYKSNPIDVRCVEDNKNPVINRPYKLSHDITTRHKREEVLAFYKSSLSNFEGCVLQWGGGPSTSNSSHFNNAYRPPTAHMSYNPFLPNENSRVLMNCEDRFENHIELGYQKETTRVIEKQFY